MALLGRHKQVAVRTIAYVLSGIFLKLLEEVYRVNGHSNVDFGGELGADSTCALAGRAESLMSFALDDQDVSASGFGKMVGDARPDDSASNYHDVWCH
jgi:hypothetical protein